MVPRNSTVLVLLVFLALLLVLPRAGFSAPLPKATQEMLKKLKLDASILADIDKELQVPQDWLEKARKEGEVRVRGTSNVARSIDVRPFRERYPFIKLEIYGSSLSSRAVKTLVAFKTGRIIGDVIESVGDTLFSFKEADALADLRNIPAMANIIEAAKDPNGLYVAHGVSVGCMAYNKRVVKASDLPKKWEDLFTIPVWRNGNLALANRPGNWAVSLWKAKGDKWTKEFLSRLFAELRPQFRKEGLSSLLELAAAGEFHAVIPASNSSTKRTVLRGAPLGFHCPEPVPSTLSEHVMVKGSPNLHAARLYINWMLSKEGQLARQIRVSNAPVHKDLQIKRFVPYGEEIFGKERSFVDLNYEAKVMPKLVPYWKNLWLRGGAAR